MTKAEIDILKKALFIAGCEEVEAYNALPDEDVVFSKEFEEKVLAINKRRKSLFYKATKTVPRRIAVVLIAAVITFTMMMGISAIRTPIINFVVKVYDSFISIFVEEEEDIKLPTSIEHMYLPTYLPEGYVKIISENYEFNAQTLWLKNIYTITLSQNILSEDSKITINNEDIDYQIVSINGIDVHYYNDTGFCSIFWSNNGYLFTLTCPEDITISEIEKIIGSME